MSVVLLWPPASRQDLLDRLDRLSKHKMFGVLIGINLGIAALILLCSNWQFAGFDQSILVDTFWKQASGQIPYRDFLTTNPPLWTLGLKVASVLFGNTWDAQALWLAIFSGLLAMWTYWLLRLVGLSRAISCLGMLCLQVPSSLVLSFWWFNGVTSLVAAVFLAAALSMIEHGSRTAVKTSFVGALTLLLLVKPNTAAILGLGCTSALLIFGKHRLRTLAVTLAGTLSSILLLLLFRISPVAVLQAYASVARSRALELRGLHVTLFNWQLGAYLLAGVWAGVLCVRQLADSYEQRRWPRFLRLVLLCIGAFATLQAASSNGDVVDVAYPAGLLALLVLIFDPETKQDLPAAFYAAFVSAVLCVSALAGFGRLRIELSGTYYVRPFSTTPVANAFFRHLHASPEMRDIARDIDQVLRKNPGPVFFADRLEWAYAAFRVPSPKHLPVFWEPGTSYGTQDEPRLLDVWAASGFETIIQQRSAHWTLSSEKYHEQFDRLYSADRTSYPTIIVWHRKHS